MLGSAHTKLWTCLLQPLFSQRMLYLEIPKSFKLLCLNNLLNAEEKRWFLLLKLCCGSADNAPFKYGGNNSSPWDSWNGHSSPCSPSLIIKWIRILSVINSQVRCSKKCEAKRTKETRTGAPGVQCRPLLWGRRIPHDYGETVGQFINT